jgi:hypothetical protein
MRHNFFPTFRAGQIRSEWKKSGRVKIPANRSGYRLCLEINRDDRHLHLQEPVDNCRADSARSTGDNAYWRLKP